MPGKTGFTADLDVERRHHEEMKASRPKLIEAKEIPRKVYRGWMTIDQRAGNQQASSPAPQVEQSKKPGNVADFERIKSLKATPTGKDWREEANVSSVKSPAQALFKREDLAHPRLNHGATIKPLKRKERYLQQESTPKSTEDTLQQRLLDILLDKSDDGLPIQHVPRHTVRINVSRHTERGMCAIVETVDSPASPAQDFDDDHRSVLTSVDPLTSATDPNRSPPIDSAFELNSDSNSEDALRKRDLRERAFGQSGNLSAIKERIVRYPSPNSTVHPALRETNDSGPYKSTAMARLLLRDDSCSTIKSSIAEVVHSPTAFELAPPPLPPRSRRRTAPKKAR